MKSVVYITKKSVWFGEQEFGLTDRSLAEVFVEVKNTTKISEVRIVLGNEVSYVMALRLENQELQTRSEVMRMAKTWLPFEITDECFDWDKITLGAGDEWAQVVAVEPGFLNVLMEAINKSGLKAEWIVPVGAVVGAASFNKETSVLLKWEGQEKLSILAQKGLVDLVVSGEDDEKINSYAKQRWHLAVNPEQFFLSAKNFEFESWVWGGKARGSDSEVLGISLVRRPVVVGEAVGKVKRKTETASSEKLAQIGLVFGGMGRWKTPLEALLVVTAIVLGVVLGFVYWRYGIQKQKEVVVPAAVVTVTPTPAKTEVVQVDLKGYRIKVLNGGGITGEADRLRSELLKAGFVNVDIGNGGAIQGTTSLFYRDGLPNGVVDVLGVVLKKYEIGQLSIRTDTQGYDATVVIGTAIRPQL